MCALPVEPLQQCAYPDEKLNDLLTALQQLSTQSLTRAAMLAGPQWCSWLQDSIRAAHALQGWRIMKFMRDVFLG